MKQYTTLLLDADETFLDFNRTEEQALRMAFAAFHLPDRGDAHAVYHDINARLWSEFALGRLDKQTLTVQRFAELFEVLALDADPAAFKVVYEDWISRGYYVFAQSNEVLCTLKKRGFTLCCVTNGLKNTQFKRLKGADLLQYFEAVFISEEAGYPKPQKEYFDYVFAHLRETDRSRILLVGDSLQTDIAGGARAGLDTVWYNPRGLAAEGEPQPTYVIRELKELLALVGPGPCAEGPENGAAEENGDGKSGRKETAE